MVIAAQADGPGIGRIRMQMIEDATAESLHAFVLDAIELGSTIHTDGWAGYGGLENKGFEREITVLGGRKKEASKLLVSRRIHISLQSTDVQEPGQAVRSFDAASSLNGAGNLRRSDERQSTLAQGIGVC